MEEAAIHPKIQARSRFSEGYTFSAGRKIMLKSSAQNRWKLTFAATMCCPLVRYLQYVKMVCTAKDMGIIGLNDMHMAA